MVIQALPALFPQPIKGKDDALAGGQLIGGQIGDVRP